MANIPKAEELFSTYVEYSNNLIQTYETNWHDIWEGYVVKICTIHFITCDKIKEDTGIFLFRW